MDLRTGEIAPLEEFKKRGVDSTFLRPIASDNHTGTFHPIDLRGLSNRVQSMIIKTGHAQIGRNSKCPCGSGFRFKSCCMMKE